MPINRSEYRPLVQSVEDDLEQGDVGLLQTQSTSPISIARRLSKRPQVDLRTIDIAFKKWTESIAHKVKRKKKTATVEKQEIMHSVFSPKVPLSHDHSRPFKTLDHGAPMTHIEYVALAELVRTAISEGIHPKMISKGSSGSYFVRAKADDRLQIVGVFKPKDEEPYGRLNPKTTKWIHRQFRWIIPFGRSCLIPNLSYISEAAASLLDERLQLYIVPRTELVSFSSPAFFYDWLDRNAAKKGKPLPGKIGSMQCFLNGFQDASEFLRVHPLPGRSISDTFDDSTHRTGGATKRCLTTLQVVCGRTGDEDLNDDQDYDERLFGGYPNFENCTERFHWTRTLQQEFREELEKLVILDFLMRNTDRGADNYMLKYCEGTNERPLIDIAPSRSSTSAMPVMRELTSSESLSSHSTLLTVTHPGPSRASSCPIHDSASSPPRLPHLHLAAIDNSLAWPHEHPKGWRSFTYGWLYLPVSVIGRPFSQKTRNHFLPLLTSKAWWEETTFQLRKLFALDPDFHPKMFRRQLAVMKGQAWNIVQCLKHSDEGPLELTRRQKVLVWDDEVEITDDESLLNLPQPPKMPLYMSHISDDRSDTRNPSEPRVRSRSIGSFPFPPPMRRSTTESAIGPGTRPVPFAGKFRRINPGASGVTVLEHMERLDEVEQGLKKLGMEDVVVEDDEEEDVGMTTQETARDAGGCDLTNDDVGDAESDQQLEALASSTISAPMLSGYVSDDDTDVGDHHKTYKTVRAAHDGRSHWRAASDHRGHRSLDWMGSRDITESALKKRIVIIERLETIDTKPFFACW